MEGGCSAARWRGRVSGPVEGGGVEVFAAAGEGAARRRGRPARAIEDGATTGVDEEGARGRFPSRAGRAE